MSGLWFLAPRASILCFGLAQYEGWNGLSHMLLTGETAFGHVNGGKDLWAYYNEPEHHRGTVPPSPVHGWLS